MKVGARNQIHGEVISIDKGSMMAKVKVKIPADSILTSVMTIESMEDLALEKGAKVIVLAKAVNVLLLTE